ncbi:MAG: homoserine kinase [Gammaproteobacteria bacterium]|nr:homoserine kinase [Gammaproteobacteria bacterium]
MSVYTRIEQRELEEFLANYSLGTLAEFSGISAGIENTNYFVTTTRGKFVLTLFESTPAEHLPYFLDLMAFTAEHGVPSAHPLADNAGHYLRVLKGRPAALVRRLEGSNVEQPNTAQCAAVGDALGHLHAVGQEFTGQRENDRGPRWREAIAARVLPCLGGDDAALLRDELDFQARHAVADTMPRGVIHADLFRDNVLFVGDTLTGMIDFYYACNDLLLYDLAVTVNDWCSREDGSLDAAKLTALLAAYLGQRPLRSGEAVAWPVMLRAAALRFWLSRLQDLHFPRKGEITHIKNPDVFKRILCARRAAGAELYIAP